MNAEVRKIKTAAELALAETYATIKAKLPGAGPVAAFDYAKFKAAPAHLVQMALKNGWATVSPKPQKMETKA